MWTLILQNAALSILSIVLVQYLWDYFKEKYTVRKTKDLVNFQTKKYREMLQTVQETAASTATESANPKPDDDYISPEEKQRMVEELMSFIAW
jgi:hypothetical protein